MMTPLRKGVLLSLLCFLCSFAHHQTVAFKTLPPKSHRLSVDNVPPNHKKFIVDSGDTRKNNDSGSNSYLHMTALDLAGDGDNENSSLSQRISKAAAKVSAFVEKNFFLLGMVVAVAMARIIPSLGKNGGILKPELFIGKFGVTLIFLFSGLSLELSELKTAATNVKANAAIQAVSFGAWPFLVGVPLTKFLRTFLPNLLPSALIDGLLVLTCLPTTVNMCIFLTSAAGGNVASSLCNAVIGNMAGIFLTPALLLRFFGTEIHLPFADMVIKLCNKVLVPVGIGQLLRKTPAKEIYTKNSKKFKRLQELILLGIVWNAFCNAFTKGMGLELRHGLALLALIPTLHVGSLFVLKKIFELPFFNFDRSQIVASVYCASHKTLAFGLPLINTIFEGNPNLASYCAPIMFIHPLQLVLGSLAVPKFSKYIEEEEQKQQ